MLGLERSGKWVELQKEAESQIQSVPIWLTPYLFLAEARASQGDTTRAIELCNFIKKQSGGNEQFDGPANKLLAQLAPKP
jgi:hypothetical protein